MRVLARVAHTKRIPAHTYLFYQDDAGDAAFVVRSGEIAILLNTTDGRELVINELRAGECFGELALLTDAPRSASAFARQESEIIVLPRNDFLGELERQPKLLRHVLEVTAQRLRASTERERALAFFDAPQQGLLAIGGQGCKIKGLARDYPNAGKLLANGNFFWPGGGKLQRKGQIVKKFWLHKVLPNVGKGRHGQCRGRGLPQIG